MYMWFKDCNTRIRTTANNIATAISRYMKVLSTWTSARNTSLLMDMVTTAAKTFLNETRTQSVPCFQKECHWYHVKI